MLEAGASVCGYYDQVHYKLLRNSHDINIRHTRSDVDHILHCSRQGVFSYQCELGSRITLPAWIGIKRKRSVHILRRHSSNVQYVERGVGFLG